MWKFIKWNVEIIEMEWNVEIIETKSPPKLLAYYLVEAAMIIINFHIFTSYSQNYNSSSVYPHLQSHISLIEAKLLNMTVFLSLEFKLSKIQTLTETSFCHGGEGWGTERGGRQGERETEILL